MYTSAALKGHQGHHTSGTSHCWNAGSFKAGALLSQQVERLPGRLVPWLHAL